ncbi:hypothetical protein NX784_01695 [Massilia pinisoli]|uniref:ABC transmembrane type-1 domain-containing protein n=1 Tax=Massilia pinisoli TaxID=1772194 RepID=A0ABT1ZK76_9BURK|nr:hypothetical protein [Massilia pinisoli]MCS0580299.1 hypothetical protein [Massilia pinisoli]
MQEDLLLEVSGESKNGESAAPSKYEIERVIGIVEQATRAVIPSEVLALQCKTGKVIDFIGRKRRALLFTALGAFVLLFLLMLIQRWVPRHVLIPLALIAAAVAELASIAMIFSEIIVELPTLNQLRKNPLSAIFSALRITTSHDLYYLQRLTECDRKALLFVQKYFVYQRTGLEKRGGLLAGNIDKIGIVPAIIAGLLFWHTLSNSIFAPWVPYLAVLLFAFHILNLISFGWQQKMDRVLALLEVVSTLKK